MLVIGLDTNVAMGHLTKNDETQWQQAVNIIRQSDSCLTSKNLMRTKKT
ncbi:MAG: hypothetical protein AAGE84_16760 [Cyanobacteria bacterium P01_G01_bin.39]